MDLGVYISVPFCKSKCSYCNFASGVFAKEKMQRYVERVIEDIRFARQRARLLGCELPETVDTIYLGGGTPSTLEPDQLLDLFQSVRYSFKVTPDAEITVECAPGTLTQPVREALTTCGVNRVSLGVQSFVDQEARAVGRLHDRAATLADIANLRAAGITNINVDLIAGLPHQTAESWAQSLSEAIGTEAPHVSVYMLEVDEDSRLGRELIAGGQRYHAHHVPDEALTVELYERARQELAKAGIQQYEISNFSKPGFESRHNLKYWLRQPYFGFGLDAHSMLERGSHEDHGRLAAARFSSGDDLERYLEGESGPPPVFLTVKDALEEEFFLGLRRNRGVDLNAIKAAYGSALPGETKAIIVELVGSGLLEAESGFVRLSPRGRLVSNEVFERLLVSEKKAGLAAGKAANPR